jgi:branched-chain amino acid transport system ATP-binding protein
MLEADNLMVFFENALALNGFSMQVKQGEIIGVIGSNSAGKTTLMNTLSGLIIDMRIKEKRKGGERISVYGRIMYKGKDITDYPPNQRVKMGIVLSRERHPIFPERLPDIYEKELKLARSGNTSTPFSPRLKALGNVKPDF